MRRLNTLYSCEVFEMHRSAPRCEPFSYDCLYLGFFAMYLSFKLANFVVKFQCICCLKITYKFSSHCFSRVHQMHHVSGEIICCQNSMTFLIPFNLENIQAATQATLILETSNMIVKIQLKTEKVLDVPSLVRNTAQ